MKSPCLNGRVVRIPLFACVTLLCAASLSLAAGIPLRFAPGASGATVEGGIARGETVSYLVGARAGQTMSVAVVSEEDNAVFTIHLPGSSGKTLPGAGEGQDAAAWKGTLPESGTYRIEVGATRGGAGYSLSVGIR